MRQRPVAYVPALLRGALILLLLSQIVFAAMQPRPTATAQALREAPPLPVLRASSLGDPIAFAQGLTLYLQAFDNQPGISIPFLDLDYAKVQSWLTRILELDPVGQYPLLMAAQVYGQVLGEAKQRKMIEFVESQFHADPNRRWPWLAHGAIMSKHRLHDLPLALRYAKMLREQATGANVPSWARQMEIFLHEDMGEYESAKVMLGGLLHSGAVTDPHEIHFLMNRLEQIEAAEKSSSTSKKRLP
jgi:hypothetical protein